MGELVEVDWDNWDTKCCIDNYYTSFKQNKMIAISLILTFIGIIIGGIILLQILGLIAQMLPMIIGFVIVFGLGYLIYIFSDKQTKASKHKEIGQDIVAKCKSMYYNSSDIQACINGKI